MKISISKITLLLALMAISASCSNFSSTEGPRKRALASENCMDRIKGEYHSYFDEVEKCIEKETHK